ncbi:DUF3169 family protein [Staphylococcus hyicus]|uniref:DUF3169 family protein n=1 Tax=Staphylococcus hyicus TaxID=1284 RepID=UPI0027387D64|nr:DUF3169 family protein [Staphylococcus hyicus]MDP4461447.1 DUF3169 family protein [Staphylococcus hyicus]
MKKGRYTLQIILATIFGGIVGVIFESDFVRAFFSELRYAKSANFLMISCIAVTLLLVALILYQFMIQNDALRLKCKSEMGNDASQDDLIAKADLQYNKSEIIFYSQLIIVALYILFLLIGGFGGETNILYVFVPLYIIFIPSIKSGYFYRKYNVNYPKIGEKDYTKKILDIKDEGERHITLLSMFKIYQFNVIGLFLAILLIFLFSITFDLNQSFSLLIVILLFIYNSLGYLLKLRKYYK